MISAAVFGRFDGRQATLETEEGVLQLQKMFLAFELFPLAKEFEIVREFV